MGFPLKRQLTERNSIVIKNVVGYEGRYVVDDCGNVFSVKSNKYIAPIAMPSGYVYVHLFNGDGKGKLMRLHRVVAEAFIDNPCGLDQVNHINGDKADNKATNLEWCSQGENMAHAIRTGLFKVSGEDNPSAKLTWNTVKEIRREYVRGDRENGTRALGVKHGVSNVMISKIVRGECWKEGDV